MPQIFDVTANENARYKRNELEYKIYIAIITKMDIIAIFVEASSVDLFETRCILISATLNYLFGGD